MKNQTNNVKQGLNQADKIAQDNPPIQPQKPNEVITDKKLERTACGLVVEENADAEEREF